jgi:hypothetical protein
MSIIEHGRCVGLTTLLSSMSRLSRQYRPPQPAVGLHLPVHMWLHSFFALRLYGHVRTVYDPCTHSTAVCLRATVLSLSPQPSRYADGSTRQDSRPAALSSFYDSAILSWRYTCISVHISELEFFLRPTVSRPVRLGIRPPFGTLDQILSCSSSFVGQLRCSAINASSLTRGRVCNLLYNCFWALPEQSHLSRGPTELTAISYCLIWDSPNLEGPVPVFISPRNRVAQLYPRALGSYFWAQLVAYLSQR